jgi:hypothetical protein
LLKKEHNASSQKMVRKGKDGPEATYIGTQSVARSIGFPNRPHKQLVAFIINRTMDILPSIMLHSLLLWREDNHVLVNLSTSLIRKPQGTRG